MTEPTSPSDHSASNPGTTAGLPGQNADPRTAQLSPDEMADTVSGTGTSDGGNSDRPEGDAGSNG